MDELEYSDDRVLVEPELEHSQDTEPVSAYAAEQAAAIPKSPAKPKEVQVRCRVSECHNSALSEAVDALQVVLVRAASNVTWVCVVLTANARFPVERGPRARGSGEERGTGSQARS